MPILFYVSFKWLFKKLNNDETLNFFVWLLLDFLCIKGIHSDTRKLHHMEILEFFHPPFKHTL